MDEIHARIQARLGKRPAVFFSAEPVDNEDASADDLDAVAIEGKVQFYKDQNPYIPGSKPYRSPVVDSPTWLDVALFANEMIETTRDFHHQFLEGIFVVGEEQGVKQARFSMGS